MISPFIGRVFFLVLALLQLSTIPPASAQLFKLKTSYSALTANMAAYECVLVGKTLHHRSNRTDNAEALRLIARAIELDPKYAHAHVWRVCVLGQVWIYGWRTDREAIWNEVIGSL